MKQPSILLLCRIGLLAASVTVMHGGTITVSSQTPPMVAHSNEFPAPFSAFEFPQFDPSNGILTSIIFSLTADISLAVNATNATSEDASVWFQAYPTVFTYGPLPPVIDLFVVSFFEGTFEAPSGLSTYTTTQHTAGPDTDGVYPYAPGFNNFIGTGSVGMPVYFSHTGPDGVGPYSLINREGGVEFDGYWQAHLTVQYNFTPAAIPEPSTMPMVGLGSIALLGLVWKRSRSGRAIALKCGSFGAPQARWRH